MIAVKPLGFENPFANRHPVHGAYIGLHRHSLDRKHFDMGIMPSTIWPARSIELHQAVAIVGHVGNGVHPVSAPV